VSSADPKAEAKSTKEQKLLDLVNNSYNKNPLKSQYETLVAEKYIDYSSYLPLNNSEKRYFMELLTTKLGLLPKDRQYLMLLSECLYTKIESVKCLNYLLDRINPAIGMLENRLNKNALNYQNMFIAEQENLLGELKCKDFTQKVMDELNYQSSKFMAEQRGLWLRNQTNLRLERNRYKSLFQTMQNQIITNKPKIIAAKHMKSVLEKILNDTIPIAKFIFSRRYAYNKKKKMNIVLRKIKNAIQICNQNINDYPLKAHEEIMINDNLKERGLENVFQAMEIINKNPQAKRIYEKLNLEDQERAMQYLTKNTENIEKVQEIEKKILDNLEISMKLLTGKETTDSSNYEQIEAKNEQSEEEEIEDEPKSAPKDKNLCLTKKIKRKKKRKPPNEK
jgi:hypothetical protein